MRRKTRLSLEEFDARINPSSNFYVASVSAHFPDGSVPGAKGTLNILANNATMTADNGTADLRVTINGIELYHNTARTISCPPCEPGGNMDPGPEHFSIPVTLPALKLPTPQLADGNYTLDFAFTGDFNASGSSQSFHYAYAFGTVDGKKGVDLTAQTANGNVTFSLNSGTGQLSVNGGNVDMSLTGTTKASIAKATAARPAKGMPAASLSLGYVTAHEALRFFQMGPVTVTEDANFMGGADSVVLGGLGAGVDHAYMTVASGMGPTKIYIQNAKEAELSASDGIQELTLGSWGDTNGQPDTITTPFISKLVDAGDFGASLVITGPAPDKKPALGNVTIHGGVDSGSHWAVTGKIGSVTVDKDFSAGSVVATSIGTIKVGGKLTADLTVTSSDPIKSITAGTMGLGHVTLPGTIEKIQTKDWKDYGIVDAGSISSIAVTGDPKDPTLGNLRDVTITLHDIAKSTNSITVKKRISSLEFTAPDTYAIHGITAAHWGGGSLTAGSIGTIKLTANPKDLNDDGYLSGVQLHLFGSTAGKSLKSLQADSIQSSTLQFDHSVGTIRTRSMFDSSITTPESLTSLVVTGGPGLFGHMFGRSTVTVTDSIGSVLLHDVDDSGNTAMVRTGKLKTYGRFAGTKMAMSLRNLDTAGTQDTLGGYSLVIT